MQKKTLRSPSKKDIDVTDLQKKLANMVKTAKVEQMKWKEERFLAQPPPPPFFQAEMDLRGIKTRVAGNIAFRGRFQSWLQDRIPLTATELRRND